MTPAWLQLAIGPAGALVVALAFAAAGYRELRRRHNDEVASLRHQLKLRTEETERAWAELRAEHAARLQDAKATTATLLQLSDRIHTTCDNLATLTRSLKTPRPP